METIQVSMEANELTALIEMSTKLNLSPAATIRRALSTYKSIVMGQATLAPNYYPSVDANMETCRDCGSMQVMHRIHYMGERHGLCCRCNVKRGEPPSDWHAECIRAAKEMNKATEKPAGEGGPGG